MSNKQTFCPTCSTTYKVTVAQLTIAQGMVCCPKCSTSFNALSYLVADKASAAHAAAEPQAADAVFSPAAQIDLSRFSFEQAPAQSCIEQPRGLLDLFEDKVENSNIDLKTYLNNLNYFSTEPIGNFPALNWTDKADTEKKRSVLNYAAWTAVNFLLIGTLLFQFFWFNPQYLKNSPVMGASFNAVCEVFNCSKLEAHYNLISTKKAGPAADPCRAQRAWRGICNLHPAISAIFNREPCRHSAHSNQQPVQIRIQAPSRPQKLRQLQFRNNSSIRLKKTIKNCKKIKKKCSFLAHFF